MEEVNDVLDIGRDDKLYGEVITLADSSADGTFLLHHFLSFFINNNRPVCFVSLSQSFGHHKSVCQKLGTNLTQSIDSEILKFIDGLKIFGGRFLDICGDDTRDSPSDSLQGLYETIKENCKDLFDKHGIPPVVIVDSLNILLNIGHQSKQISAFVQYLCHLNSSSKLDARGTVVVFVSSGEDSSDGEASLLWKSLVHMSSVDVYVSGLDSGYCKDVHGKVK